MLRQSPLLTLPRRRLPFRPMARLLASCRRRARRRRQAKRPRGRQRSRAMGYKAALRVWRGDAGAGELTDYQVEVNEGEVVLDVLHRLQATQAGDLAIRWNCKAGKCGACSVEINGRPP